MSKIGTNTTYRADRPRNAAGQRVREDTLMQKHSLESLICDIDNYIAEQEAYSRPSLARSDSRGTMFVDVGEEGKLVVSYRHQSNSDHPKPTTNQREENELPDNSLYVVDGPRAYASRYVTARDGTHFARVAINTAGRGIYVPVMERHRYDFEEQERQHRLKEVAKPRPCPHTPTFPTGYYSGKRHGEYPRPMRRMEVKMDKPLPRVPHRHRKRRSFFESIKEAVRKLCGE